MKQVKIVKIHVSQYIKHVIFYFFTVKKCHSLQKQAADVLCFDHVSDFSGKAVRSAFRSTNFAFSGGYGASCALQTKTSVTRPVFSAFRFPTGTTTKSPTASGKPPVR